MLHLKKLLILTFLFLGSTNAQFYDTFEKEKTEGWFAFTGDGLAEVKLLQMKGFLRISVDATRDKYNVWWAVSKRNVAANLDLAKLKNPDYEVRVEARVKVGNAPRRINMMVNTQRTTNFHKDLMEFDIPDTSNWYTISMTTKDLDAVPGDSLFVQLNIIDWGIGTYHVDMDYYKADIINIKTAGPDKGFQVPYHPPLQPVDSFKNKLTVTQDALINFDFPDVNFNNWASGKTDNIERVLTINARQWAILRWDLKAFENSSIKGSGLLELKTHSIFSGGKYTDVYGDDLGVEFGKVRVIEILAGNPQWQQEKVTLNNLLQGDDLYKVFNSQMIFDCELSVENDSLSFVTLSQPVLQRLISGRTKGILIRPLGAIDASIYALEAGHKKAAKLYFNTEENQ